MLHEKLEDNMLMLDKIFGGAGDFYKKEVDVCGIKCAIALCDGQASLAMFWNTILLPLAQSEKNFNNPQKLAEYIQNNTSLPFTNTPVDTKNTLFTMLTAGFAVLFIDGVPLCFCFAAQAKPGRAIGEPSAEGNLRSSREGFCEILQLNMALVRRRMRSEKLRIDTMPAGTLSKTDIAVFYLEGVTPLKLVASVKERLRTCGLPAVFDAGYLTPFLKKGNLSFFSGVGYTERPDTLAAKLCEGKVAVLVDGSPFALLTPYFFSENFQTMDDYTAHPYFASFARLLKYSAFFISILLPGVFVSAVNFTPQLVPEEILTGIMAASIKTPFPLFAEALIIIFMLEIVREAGLRIPRPLGQSLGLLAALIIGDAAVKNGLVTSISLVVMAVTFIATFTVPALYEATTVLRILFVLAGGLFGPVGIVLAFALLLFNLTAVNVFGLPYTAPLTPYSSLALRDGVWRASLKKLQKNAFTISTLTHAKTGVKGNGNNEEK